jgi:hypothetical protein
LAPYEEINKDLYDKLRLKIKESMSFVDNINNLSIDNLDCDTGACPIK